MQHDRQGAFGSLPLVKHWLGPLLLAITCFICASHFGRSRAVSGLIVSTNGADLGDDSPSPGLPVQTANSTRSSEALPTAFDGISLAGLESAIQLLEASQGAADAKAVASAQAAFRRLRELSGLTVAVHRALKFGAAVAKTGEADGELACGALLGIFRAAPPAQEEVMSLLPGLSTADTLRLVECYFACAPRQGFAASQALAERFWMATGQPLDEAIRTKLRRSLYTVFAERDDIEGLLTGAQEIKAKDGQKAALRDIGKTILLWNPDLFERFITGIAAQDPRMAAGVMADNPLNIGQITTLLAALPESAKHQVLNFYCDSFASRNPTDILEFANAFPPDKLPKDTASYFCRSLLATGSGSVAGWLSHLPEGERAAVLDRVNGSLRSSVSPTAAMTWLQARLEVKPAIEGEALRELFGPRPMSYRSFVQDLDRSELLSLVGKLPAALQEEAFTAVFKDSGETVRRLKMDPQAELAEISSLPEGIRSGVLNTALWSYYCPVELCGI